MACYPFAAVSDADSACRICETAACDPDRTQASPRIRAWTDDEVARIRRVLQRLTGMRVLNDEDAEDLVQETLLTATEKLPDCSLRKGLLVWCMGVLRKKVGNYYRKANRYTPLDSCEILAWKCRSARALPQSPEARVHQMELSALIGRIIAGLPIQERRPIELYLEGLPTWEIAQQLRPERYQNVLNRIYRGRKKLARQLARFGYAPPVRRSAAPERRTAAQPAQSV